MNMNDEDFVENCTEFVWGCVGACDEMIAEESIEFYHRVVRRMTTLLPKSKWQALITQSVQTNLRLESPGELDSLLAENNLPHSEELRAMALEAMLQNYDVKKWKPVYGLARPYLLRFAEPMPILLLSTNLFEQVFAYARAKLSPEEYATWIRQKDQNGENVYQKYKAKGYFVGMSLTEFQLLIGFTDEEVASAAEAPITTKSYHVM